MKLWMVPNFHCYINRYFIANSASPLLHEWHIKNMFIYYFLTYLIFLIYFMPLFIFAIFFYRYLYFQTQPFTLKIRKCTKYMHMHFWSSKQRLNWYMIISVFIWKILLFLATHIMTVFMKSFFKKLVHCMHYKNVC